MQHRRKVAFVNSQPEFEHGNSVPANMPAVSGTTEGLTAHVGVEVSGIREAIDALPGKKARRPGKLDLPLLERAAFSMREFAALHGRHEVWAYRLAYSQKIKVIHDLSGQMMVPRQELERLANSAQPLTMRRSRAKKRPVDMSAPVAE